MRTARVNTWVNSFWHHHSVAQLEVRASGVSGRDCSELFGSVYEFYFIVSVYVLRALINPITVVRTFCVVPVVFESLVSYRVTIFKVRGFSNAITYGALICLCSAALSPGHSDLTTSLPPRPSPSWTYAVLPHFC